MGPACTCVVVFVYAGSRAKNCSTDQPKFGGVTADDDVVVRVSSLGVGFDFSSGLLTWAVAKRDVTG